MTFPVPRNETRRLAELRDLGIVGTAPEPSYGRIARLATRHFAMPMAAVTFVDEHRVWYKAAYGLSVRDVAREGSCCTHAILRRDVLVVGDVGADARFERRASGVGMDDVRFYAGAPLWTADGCALGVLCVMDTSPREFTREDEETLADMAAMATTALALHKTTLRLGQETGRSRRAQRTLARQDLLLRRLNEAQEDHIRLRVTELTGFNESLHAQVAGRERAEAALQSAKEEAEKANRAKSEFLLRMSHELRTPLNAILGFGQILQGTVDAEGQRTGAAHIVTAGRHLLSLINEVLDIARIEAGRLDLSLSPVGVPQVVGEALDLIRPLAAERRIALEVRSHAGSGPVVSADRQRLKQVLLNLLSNAVKYSPEASRVTVHWRTERGRTLRLCVSDEGPGIPRERAARLFVAFERLGAEGSGIPGTGLGLVLSKRLVEAMRGKIGARVGTGRGSTFWVRLPLCQELTRLSVPAALTGLPPVAPPPVA